MSGQWRALLNGGSQTSCASEEICDANKHGGFGRLCKRRVSRVIQVPKTKAVAWFNIDLSVAIYRIKGLCVTDGGLFAS